MRIGQTSVIVFLGKILASAAGFAGTIYFSRELGPEIIGIYATIIALITWFQLSGKIGVHSAITKRLSENNQRGKYLTAGLFISITTTTILTLCIVFFREYIELYIRDFSEYSDISVAWFISILVFIQIFYHIVNSVLQGQRLVHVVGLLRPIRTGSINGIQFMLVFFFGFGLVGLVIGHIVGIIVAASIGTLFISVRPRWPERYHFVKIYSYAKYSWLSSLTSRTFSNADILILGFFVPPNLVGVYSVAWMLSSSLQLFAGSISSTIFPEISNIASEENKSAASSLIEDTISYAGLIVIPGLVGGVLLDNRLFEIYGEGFGQGVEVLGFLLISILAYSYLSQFSTALNGLDHPDLVFRINIIFILFNIILNVILIQSFGWVGAAVASATSTILGACVSYYYLSQIVMIEIPLNEIGKQVTAAIGMGIIILAIKDWIKISGFSYHNIIVVGGLVGIGASTYVAILSLISEQFRSVIKKNTPINKIFML